MVKKEDFNNLAKLYNANVHEYGITHTLTAIGKVLLEIKDAIDNNTKVHQEVLDNFKESRKDIIITERRSESR